MMDGWSEFGWQGIRALVPPDYEIGGISGDHKSGYIRLDDSIMPRLEMKWSAQKKKPDLDVILDEYFKGLRKQEKKRKGRMNIKRKLALVKEGDADFQKVEAEFYTWKSGRVRAFGMVRYCADCRRTLIVQLSGFSGENTRKDAIAIFRSVSDHPDGTRNLWTAYGMSVLIPRRYRLESHKMMSAYLLFSFADGSRKIAVERYGLADVLLRSISFEDWFRRTYAKAMKGYGFGIRLETTDDDHQSLILEGERSRFTDGIPIPLLSVMNRVVRRKRMSAMVWSCGRSNRIFAVRAIAKTDTTKIVDDVGSSIRCHEEEN
jgi:hypothetical protein